MWKKREGAVRDSTLDPAPTLLPATLPLLLLLRLLLPRREREVLRPRRGPAPEEDGHWAPWRREPTEEQLTLPASEPGSG
jgi:hypothetical protein